MSEQQQIDKLKLTERIMEAMAKGEPRYLRAKQFADQILHLMQDFVPQDRVCRRQIHTFLVERAFEANASIIEVRPEWDAMDKLKIEAALHDLKMEPVSAALRA